MSRLWAVLIGVLATLTTAGVAPTTTASAAPFTYDVPAIARVDVQPFGYAEASATQLSELLEASASPSEEARGTSTTAPLSVVATNPVRPGTDLVKYEAYPPAATSPRGFVGGPVRNTLQPGTAISRYGGEGGPDRR